ncbi:aminotransferase-like domain-containing protein [Paenibacillus radicis (ex Gao et al. 2016)]|uniref:Aminotransferase n=1 Tax=Paenibacillus radicis (ex Gao et al. 2016) TaxID=1737354 RepID=A0A917H673_9BACL|nr:PLP-dependent aminotransferase family protein [Paenibacillus radicis (ex Gao et al. 2016)]GGG68456.1 aminotransferase [Paenibacillus radicis (ex Gao et al. 2016)]
MSKSIEASLFSRHLPAPSIGGTRISNPGHIHLSYGFPATDLLPVQELQAAAGNALQRERSDALHYTGAIGPGRVRDWVLNRVKKVGIEASAANFLPVFGAIQGIDLTSRILLTAGDEVWVERPTFFNALQSFRAAGASIRSFPVDEEGLRVDELEAALLAAVAAGEALPKLVYIMPNYHNPTGATLSTPRRQQLAKLAVDYNFFILEDDAYVELNISGESRPAVYTFAPERVIYVSTFSKTLGPGLRLGWIIASTEAIGYLATLSLGSQLNPFTQEIVGELLEEYDFDEQVNRLTDRYREQRDLMIGELEAALGSDIEVNVPDGGFFIWVKFGESINVNDFYQLAITKGVSFVAGNAFFHDGQGSNYLRLCFSYCSMEQIARGVRALADSYYESVQSEHWTG